MIAEEPAQRVGIGVPAQVGAGVVAEKLERVVALQPPDPEAREPRVALPRGDEQRHAPGYGFHHLAERVRVPHVVEHQQRRAPLAQQRADAGGVGLRAAPTGPLLFEGARDRVEQRRGRVVAGVQPQHAVALVGEVGLGDGGRQRALAGAAEAVQQHPAARFERRQGVADQLGAPQQRLGAGRDGVAAGCQDCDR